MHFLIFGPYWALFGPYWALFGPIGSYLTLFGRVGPYLALLGPIWPYWALFGHIGPYLALTVNQKRNTEGPGRGHRIDVNFPRQIVDLKFKVAKAASPPPTTLQI